jgi:hypothetical protein
MTDIWGLSNGFSHQIVQIYVDHGQTSYGSTEMLDGANAEIDDDWAWEVAISGTGEPGAVFAVQSETGSTSSRGIDVSGDVDAKTITFTVSKDVIGDDIPNYRYIIVIGSQDGFGTGKWRDVDETPSTWTLGGGSNPAADDGIDYDPNIIDMILNGSGQEQMLSSYDVENHVYAKLTGFEMPEVPQQIFGASIEAVTASTAVITWSTTVSDMTSIQYALAGQQPVDATTNLLETASGTDHAVTLTDLDVGTAYWVFIRAEGTDDVILYFNTSTVVDETPPELLNLAAEVLEDGRVKITWYTSEGSTEEILIDSTSIHSDPFAIKKNHEFVTEGYANGDYIFTVKSSDASGNSNESTVSVTIELEGENTNPNPTTPNDSTNTTDEDEKASPVSSGIVQIGILVTILVLLIAFARVRNGQNDGDDKWV